MTQITTEFKWTAPEGKEFIAFEDWVNTLPEQEKAEFQAGQVKQNEYRQAAIDAGKLKINLETGKPISYTWTSPEALTENKPHDPVWQKYWDRYHNETGIVFELVAKETNADSI